MGSHQFLATIRTASPSPPGSPQTFTYVSDGDTNDIFYFIGRNFGTASWANPHPARITNVRSTDLVGTPADLTDRAAQDTYTDNLNNSWIVSDLGSGVAVVLSKYLIRIRNVADPRAIRNWKIQGSNDPVSNSVIDLEAATWVDIDSRVADTTMPNTSGVWQVYTVPSMPAAYRWIRFLENGANSSGSDFFLTICEWQLYGVLTF